MTVEKVAASYSTQQVLLCSIDILKNPDVREFLINGSYPTVRIFSGGKATEHAFLGVKDEAYVRNFIDNGLAK